jgi:hypothetical protein
MILLHQIAISASAVRFERGQDLHRLQQIRFSLGIVSHHNGFRGREMDGLLTVIAKLFERKIS